MCVYKRYTVDDMLWSNCINLTIWIFIVQVMDFSRIEIQDISVSIKRRSVSAHVNTPLSYVLGAATPVSTV